MAYHEGLATQQILIPAPLADNLPAADPPRFLLPDHALVELEGPDATVFAQAQFANDVAGLESGHWQWNAWLTPKGRVIALFALLKFSASHLCIVLPDHPADDFAMQLQRFVFRRKLKVVHRNDWLVSGSFTPPVCARQARFAQKEGSWELDYGSEAAPRTLYLGPLAGSGTDTGAVQRWHACDLRYGLPRLSAAQRGQWTPQQLSLDRLHAYSVKKGCYPGQEIVARTHFLGKAKRGLMLLESSAPLHAGDELRDSTRDAGQFIGATTQPPWLGLAVASLDLSSPDLACAGQPLLALPLLEGLVR